MNGLIDDPPIIIRQSRVKLMFNFAVWILLACLLLIAKAYPTDHLFPYGYEFAKAAVRVLIYAGLFTFASLAVVTALSLVVPARLKLEPGGLVCWTIWRSRRFEWDDIERFDVRRSSLILSHAYICYNLSQRYLWEHPHRHAPLGGFDFDWEEDASEVLLLLNGAKAKWGEDRTPREPDVLPKQSGPDRKVA